MAIRIVVAAFLAVFALYVQGSEAPACAISPYIDAVCQIIPGGADGKAAQMVCIAKNGAKFMTTIPGGIL